MARTDQKDPEYLTWVRSQPCAKLECEQVTVTRAHHFKHDLHLSGGSMRASDFAAMPLCDNCHVLFHSRPDEWRDDQRAWLIRTLLRALADGVIVRGEGSELPW